MSKSADYGQISACGCGPLRPIPTRRFGSRSAPQSPIKSAASEKICVPIQIKHVHFSSSYQQAINKKCNRRGEKLPSGYGALPRKVKIACGRSRPFREIH